MGLKNKIKELRSNRSKSGGSRRTSTSNSKKQGLLEANPASQVRAALDNKKQFDQEASFNFRILAFAGGLSMVSTSGLSVALCVIHFMPLKLLIYTYTLLFGLLICILEGHFIKSDTLRDLRQSATEGMPILRHLWGRGAFYMVSGSLQMSHTSPMNVFSGFYLVGVGFVYVIMGIYTRRRLRKLKKSLKDERCLKRHFKRFDRDGDGVLDMDEFGAFVANMTGEDLDEDDLEAAFGVIDKSGNGYVTLDEFKRWWSGFSDEDGNQEAEGDVVSSMT